MSKIADEGLYEKPHFAGLKSQQVTVLPCLAANGPRVEMQKKVLYSVGDRKPKRCGRMGSGDFGSPVVPGVGYTRGGLNSGEFSYFKARAKPGDVR